MSDKRKFSWGKWLSIPVIAAAVAGGIWLSQRDNNDKPIYQTGVVTRGDLTQVVMATGTLNPMTNVTVGSQISGNIEKLYADWNSPVAAGQVVAELDPAIYKAAVQQAQGDLANAIANLELAKVEEHRASELIKSKLISESDNDTAVAALHQAEAVVMMKQASLDNAKLNFAHCTIYSPVKGTVISRNVDVGQTVAASMSAPTLFIIANDLTEMQIDANVSEADVGTVEEGQTVEFTVDAFPERKFTGKVIQIRNSPITVQNVVTYDTVIRVNNADLKLRPGMTATASIITAQRKGVLKIPNAALRFKPFEGATNQTFTARLLAKLGLGKGVKQTPANLASNSAGTNKTEAAANGEPPLTGNEPPQELARRVREMRDRGEEPPPEIRAKLRELYQSGALQRPGGGGPGGGGGARSAQPGWRNVYTLVTTTANGGDPVSTPQLARVRAGISDNFSTEITEGLKEGDVVITSARMPQGQTPPSPQGGGSPFGGGGRRF